MAIDAALLAAAMPGIGVWRWYGWSAPTISFGRNERVAGRFSSASVAAAGLTAVRRPTGGRALLHAREITYSVTLGLAPEAGWREAYDAVNHILHAALRRLGVDAQRAGAQPPVAPDGPVCFDRPAEGELVVGGRKLVGSAVWRQGTRYLQHGSILLHDDQAMLTTASLHPLDPIPPAAALLEMPGLGNAETTTLALDAAVRHVLSQHGAVTAFMPPASLLEEIGVQRSSFIDADQLWRR
jgi:lipoate-protein ligase A